jgi:hypothetical protein
MRVGRAESLPPLEGKIMMQNAAGGIKIYSFMFNEWSCLTQNLGAFMMLERCSRDKKQVRKK